MGGVNHQPCRAYLRNSTKLSRHLSLAYAELELGNVVLEDLILLELSGKSGTVEGIVSRLINSEKSLENAVDASAALRVQMDDICFTDLPTLATINLKEVGSKLAAKKVVAIGSWHIISRLMKENGFYAALSRFEVLIKELLGKTKELRHQFEELSPAASRGEVSKITEKNLTGNIKVAFAQLYTAWANFHQVFLASSMLSTELWYRENDYGSLVESKQVAAVL